MPDKKKAAMPLDQNAQSVPVLGLDTDGSINIADGALSGVINAEYERVVRIVPASADAWILFGENPTPAASTGALFPLGSVEYVKLRRGEQIAVSGSIVNITITS